MTKNEPIKTTEDLIVGYTNDSPEGKVYDPIILKFAFWGAVIVGLILGVASYLIAEGTWPITDFGQFSSSSNGVATTTGTGIGMALGGLIGALSGMFRMLKKPKHGEY